MNYKLLFLLSVFIYLTLSCTNKRESITPEVKSITESVYASGFIKSNKQYEVYSRFSGIIKTIFVTEGMQVKKGDPIFQLDNKDLKIATENARLASATADYKLNADKLQDAGKAIDMATKKRINDSLLYYRQKNLWSNNIGSKVELEQRELSFENAKVDLASASTNYQDLKRQLKLLSDQSKNNLEIAKLMEDDFIIRSEVDGVVYKINKEEGELTNGLEPEAVIGTDEFIIELSIDELDIVKVKKGQQVLIRMDSYKNQVFEAEIITIDPMMNIRTRSFQAEAIFTKKPGALFPNLTAEANILINTKEDALTIPRNYLINDTYVMLEGGTLQKVETGLMDYDLVEIKSGINKTTIIELPEE
ncbi:efflux RND transporter periplasmic adaptor subunit [Aequorivita antarctica]|uniref:HlyD family efflux transporter periplasmic adaptor subunit n=1 Tax=Aequorivita antarctica TaxID=153266 RepID=A0A5C6YX44_9FLAO|nr:efflux RND transporter periplasmic adaptor subunit [Aequorivita antarctica]TXD72136.1 HlyD family efflux transporter periplasmic adaptor subunit [Aequorivita antarctica]SRX75179.1 Putative efflux system component YknX [Aequorivita antarctica]